MKKKGIEVTVIAVNIKTLAQTVVADSLVVWDTKTVFKTLREENRHQLDAILVIEPGIFQLQSRVLDSNVKELTGKLMYYAVQHIEQNQEQLFKDLVGDFDFGINEGETAVFQKLKDALPKDELVLAKTSIGGIPTMAICEQVKEGDEIRLMPLVIVVTPDIYKQLTMPDNIQALVPKI